MLMRRCWNQVKRTRFEWMRLCVLECRGPVRQCAAVLPSFVVRAANRNADRCSQAWIGEIRNEIGARRETGRVCQDWLASDSIKGDQIVCAGEGALWPDGSRRRTKWAWNGTKKNLTSECSKWPDPHVETLRAGWSSECVEAEMATNSKWKKGAKSEWIMRMNDQSSDWKADRERSGTIKRGSRCDDEWRCRPYVKKCKNAHGKVTRTRKKDEDAMVVWLYDSNRTTVTGTRSVCVWMQQTNGSNRCRSDWATSGRKTEGDVERERWWLIEGNHD